MTRIILICHNDLLVRAMEILIEDGGYEVIIAFDDADGLNLIKTAKPDLILLDLTIPGMNGWKTLEKIKSNSLNPIPVIIIAYKDQMGDIWKMKEELGFTDYVTKPFDLDVLYSKIDNAFQL